LHAVEDQVHLLDIHLAERCHGYVTRMR
jgi:hypothetical protein